jgi:hypothetical protein
MPLSQEGDPHVVEGAGLGRSEAGVVGRPQPGLQGAAQLADEGEQVLPARWQGRGFG